MRKRLLSALFAALVVSPPELARADDVDAGAADSGPSGAGANHALLDGVHEQTDTLTRVQVGMYVNRIIALSQRDGTFDIDAWVWFRWQGSEVTPHEGFEVANGTIHDREATEVIDDGGFNYVSVRITATVYHAFDVRHFPFDDHVLTIEIEDSNLEYDNQQFVVDQGIDLDEAVSVEGWRVKLLRARTERHVYPTTYGYRSLDSTTSTYSRFVVPIALERRGLTPLFKLFWVSYLSVVLGLLAFRIRSNDLDARFGLGTGSIFAASANAFVVSEQLPETSHLTLAEQVNLLAVGCIFLSVFLSVASLRLRYRDRDADSERLDRWSLVGLSIAYVIGNAIVLGQAFV